MGGQCFEFVGCSDKGQGGDIRNCRSHTGVPTDAGVEPRAHGCAALGQFVNVGQAHFDPRDAFGHLGRIARKLLPQGQGRGILRMGAADLDDVFELHRFGMERPVQFFQPRQQHIARHHADGDVHRRGKGVVRGLAHVHMVVRMHGLFRPHHPAQHFNRAV